MTNHDYGRREVLTATAMAVTGLAASTGTTSAAAGTGPATAQTTASWPLWGFDSGGTRYNPSIDPPSQNLTLQGSVDVGGTPISVAGENAVYSAGGRLVSLTHDGEENWSNDAPSGADQWELPALVGDTLYASASDVGVFAFDAASGELQWQYDSFDSYSGLYTPYDGGVIASETAGVDTNQGHVTAIDGEGQQRWETTIEGLGFTVVVGDSVYAPDQTGMVALDAASGEERWTHETQAEPRSAVPVATEDRVYYDDQQSMYALDPETGEEQWRVQGTLAFYPVLTGERLFATIDNTFSALDPETGEVLDQYGDIQSFTFAGASDSLYGLDFANGEFQVYSMSDGTVTGSFSNGTSLVFPALTEERIYVGDQEGRLNVLVEGEESSDDSTGDDSTDDTSDDGGDSTDDSTNSTDDSGSDDGSSDDSTDDGGNSTDDSTGDEGNSTEDSDSDDGSGDDSTGDGDGGGSEGSDSNSDGETDDGSGDDGEDGQSDDGGSGNSIPGFGAVATLAGLGSVAGWLANRDDGDDPRA